ncbi:hypothetical protein P152DRAFT_446107 [Eremomyces bilateralis CBS 781.70]|uniref:HTH CENPB-type domain-containing protein n=1 Tax=Eremomyces bilateralis CBS 781.70 TaxID=1392243 RepID=A0A6G1GEW0_9PEZI|nr:uncharacterized protein P152DRAFT_446107 [Eremomyces bilateralis CBS 781.70]KAF1816456.1 hypothetical protein P152DRAFT_446107 [Eremomyces bilateralis CBS 781.70]
MDHDHQQHQEPGSTGGYHDGGGNWVDTNGNPYPHSVHQSPVHEYPGFAFAPMPMEPMYTHGMPSTMPPPRPTHQLQPLVMPQQQQWPSMLTSQSTYVPPIYPSTTPAVPVAPASTPISATSTSSRTSTPRKTLTDTDRRRMCLYHEEHPNVKQTEIGAMFGVERSTVSKVLRNKEKYLYQEDGSRSPAKKSKGKSQDLERAVSTWARNQQNKRGMAISDQEIRERFRYFATALGTSEGQAKANSNSWLNKFRAKNNLLGSKSRKGSIAEDSEDQSNPASQSQTPGGISPTTPDPAGTVSPIDLAMAVTKTEEGAGAGKAESPDHFFDFNQAQQNHRPFHSQSNTSLSSVFTDAAPSSFSPGPTSPTSPFFSPESATGQSPFVPTKGRMTSVSGSTTPGSNGFQRPRSQTFPMLGIEPQAFTPSTGPTSDSLTPKYIPSTARDSPMGELSSNPLPSAEEQLEAAATSASEMPPPSMSASSALPPLTTAQHQPVHSPSPVLMPHVQTRLDRMHQSSPITPASVTTAPNSSTESAFSPIQHRAVLNSTPQPAAGSPSQEDARRALEVVMQFFQHQPSGLVEPQEYVTIGKLMEKLKLRRQSFSQPGGVQQLGIGLGVAISEGMRD